MDLASILENKRVCVLMTCRREPYLERVKEREYVYNMIQRNGFVFFYLYCDPTMEEEYKIDYAEVSGRYTLTVKCAETWNALGVKMWMCYSFFSQYNIKGVLKIDDDVDIDTEYEEMIFSSRTFEYDYLGMAEVSIEFLRIKMETDVSDSHSILLQIKDKPIRYFGGPMYWVSKTAIGKLADTGPVSPCEDVNVGYTMTLWQECRWKNTHWHQNGVVSWL